MEIKEFDFYDSLKDIITEIEKDENYKEELILKKLIFITSCELSTFFLDNIFVSNKSKFKDFEDTKKYTKIMMEILYQIFKQFPPYPYRCVINLFETLNLGNYELNSMIFFFKVELCFYYTHQLTMLKVKEEFSFTIYENKFKENYKEGFGKMKDLLRVIPLIILNLDYKDDNLINTIFRINYTPEEENNISLPNRPKSNLGNNPLLTSLNGRGHSLPPIKNKSFSSSQEGFFSTAVKDK